MKIKLFATSGLFAAAMLVGAAAQANGVAPVVEPQPEKIKLGLGGFMEQWVGWIDEDTGMYRNFDQKSDTEVYFIGKTTLDNGLNIMARIELEGDKGPTAIDKSWLSIGSSSMGTLNLGSVNTVTDNMHHYPPDVGIGLFDADNWIVESSAARVWTSIDPGDHNVVQYVSPSWSGFQFGVEYASDPNKCCQTRNQPLITSEDYFAGVIAYNGDFNGFSVGFDVGALIQNIPLRDDDREEFQAGASIGYGGFTVSGGYFMGNYVGAWGEEEAWAVGASYGQGPWAVSLTYQYGETNEAIDPVFAPWGATHNDEFTQILLSGKYAIGPGIALKGSIFYVDAIDQGITSNEGMGIVGGIRVDF